MSIFYYTVGSAVRAKINGSIELYSPIAEKKGYTISFSESLELDEESVQIDELFFDGSVVRKKPLAPSVDSEWDESTNTWTEDLQSVKARQKQLINASRVAANSSSFTYGGKTIACNPLSRSDIEAINGLILLGGGFPVGFNNEWKAIDNTYVPIPDIQAWADFYGAMVAFGIANFQKAQTKKAAIDAAITIQAVKAVVWDDASQL